jgi:hypothetical protein
LVNSILIESTIAAYAAILMARRYSSMPMEPLKETPPVTLMHGKAATISNTSTPLCVTGRRKGPAMMMAVASTRSIPTRRRPGNDGAQFPVSVEALFAW